MAQSQSKEDPFAYMDSKYYRASMSILFICILMPIILIFFLNDLILASVLAILFYLIGDRISKQIAPALEKRRRPGSKERHLFSNAIIVLGIILIGIAFLLGYFLKDLHLLIMAIIGVGLSSSAAILRERK